jgi:hypothetical protein
VDIAVPRGIWTLPGALLWLPTGVNAFVVAEIVQLWWEGRRAQADLEIALHILAMSVPMSVVLLVGVVVFLIMRRSVGARLSAALSRGVSILLVLNIAAPFILYYGLKWIR